MRLSGSNTISLRPTCAKAASSINLFGKIGRRDSFVYLSYCSDEANSNGSAGGEGGGGEVEDRVVERFRAATEDAGLLRLYLGGIVGVDYMKILGGECLI
ncbi:hypothetical protein JCGZ_27076 [Jatropha curcas]|uniref:Uncharacterized protein n=1 Tax=Jatropha curcas TaxID=180498 RepID=A0A067JMI3_JATCU|nr:hypothetical protein JCGZ_27076 [Jatropha curcas]